VSGVVQEYLEAVSTQTLDDIIEALANERRVRDTLELAVERKLRNIIDDKYEFPSEISDLHYIASDTVENYLLDYIDSAGGGTPEYILEEIFDLGIGALEQLAAEIRMKQALEGNYDIPRTIADMAQIDSSMVEEIVIDYLERNRRLSQGEIEEILYVCEQNRLSDDILEIV